MSLLIDHPSRGGVAWDADGAIEYVGDYPAENWENSLQCRDGASMTEEIALRRYEYLRTLNPKQFSDLWQEALTGTTPFDTLVDVAIITLKGN